MTTIALFLPLAGALAVVSMPADRHRLIRGTAIAVSAAVVALVGAMWAGFSPGGGVQFNQEAEWIPALGVGYRVGVDGLSLPLIAMTAVLFLAAMIFPAPSQDRVKEYFALFLVLETTSLGVFAALDLILFFVFWDLSIVAMYFVIAFYGHADRERSALKFFLYTFLGSLALLLGIIGLYLGSDPRTFDMLALAEQSPLAGQARAGGFVLLALSVGFAIKTPLVPVHTWLPPAHVDAPAAGSAILAGVMLKMGTYGFVRIAMSILPEHWRRYAMVAVVVGVVSALYGALVALAQPSFKRLVAYTSVNHMGYVLLGLGAVGVASGAATDTQVLAVSGAVTQMVAHGLVTGLLFLLTGVLWARAGTYDFDRFGGLAAPAPAFAAVTGLAAFASLGLPGLVQFIGEFQIFVGSLAAVPVAAALALLGVLLTAALFLWTLQRLFLGPVSDEWATMPDLRPAEWAAVLPLAVLVVLLGVLPRGLLDVIEPAARNVVTLLGS